MNPSKAMFSTCMWPMIPHVYIETTFCLPFSRIYCQIGLRSIVNISDIMVEKLAFNS